MKERGMIFNAEMVRAILEGRKTQTRRIVKPQPEITSSGNLSGEWLSKPLNGLLLPKIEDIAIHCPFGNVGERLWVREAFRVHSRATDVATLVYRASERNSWTEQTRRVPVSACSKPVSPEKWTPSIHMPRYASRILLEITDVRVEKLKNIPRDGIIAEGYPAERAADGGECDPFLWYRDLWESLYGAGSWQANPWIWVISFKRVEVA
ncbi:hypothetical protein [Pectobacterium aroidearum]|uniref:hypothetical protein n=1 Tax=Pectobacterium aroidearum TaxID=1201031 RepID=UPI00301A5585